MTDRIARSVAFTIEADKALDRLATTEGTSRADLVRQGLTMLFRSRGIDLDVTAGIDLHRVAVTHRRDRRAAPPRDAVCAAFADWWDNQRDTVLAQGHDPDLADKIIATIIERTDRTGRAYDVIETMVPGAWKADREACYAINDVIIDLITTGGVARGRRRNGPAYLAPAPWAIET
jgi:hypothetical protein